LAKTKVKPTIEELILEYKLAELPSSQHRAGLAGLVLIYRWLTRNPSFQEKLDNGAICRIEETSEGAKIELNQTGLAALFDEIYAASAELTSEPKIRLNKKKEEIPAAKIIEEEVIDKKTNLPKIDKKTGEVQKKITYCYPVAIPKGSFLADTNYDSSKERLWIKLWRDVVWSIFRGVPTTRKPYEARADGEYAEDAAKVWQELTQPETFTVDLPSTYFLGVQVTNAENVPFKDRTRYQLLLHFWSFACQIYVPQTITLDRDKEAKKIIEKREFVGYAIAIPDIANLEDFCDGFLDLLSSRSPKPSGYRPLDSIIDLPMESALSFSLHLAERLSALTGKQNDLSSTISGFDIIHAEKEGNNVRIRSSTRLTPDRNKLSGYKQIKDNYWNPLFRRQRLINLINDKPWYAGFDALLCTIPYEQSMENNSFQHDANEAFKNEVNQMTQINPDNPSKEIDTLVFDLVKTYINRKLGSKYELKWSEIKDKSDDEKKNYGDKKEKIAKDVFLAVRSRTEKEDFINYFASTLCSVPQYMKSEDYLSLTKALYQDTDRVRTLTLLALSANS
jgi:CRISPR-associated protein Cmx8